MRRDPPLWRGLKTVSTPPGIDAEAHATIRLENIVKTACLVYHLRRKGCLAQGVAVERFRAKLQLLKGTRADRTEAAHNLPCEVEFGKDSLWQVVEAQGTKAQLLATSVQGWFASTVVLPDHVNKTDSLWEAKGLRDAYATFLAAVAGLDAPLDLASTRLAQEFRSFRFRANAVLSNAEAHARERYQARAYYHAMMGVFADYRVVLWRFDPAPTLTAHFSPAMVAEYDVALG